MDETCRLFWDRKDVGLFPRGGKCAKSVGKLE